MRPVSNTPLTPEARATIRQYLAPSMGETEVQRLIDEYEGVTPEPPQAPLQDPTRADLWAPAPARSLQDGCDKLVEAGGDRKALGLAVAGKQTELFQSDLPYDSLLERSYRNCRPTIALLPAVDVALRSPEPKNAGEALDLAAKMFESLDRDPNDPMQKGFAGIRMLMAVVKKMGDIRVVGLDGMSTPLRNLRDDAKSDTFGKIIELEVQKSFDELRTFVDERGNSVGSVATITEGLDTVTIGGVTLEVRK